MMKKRLLAFLLCAALPLSGCSALLERGHETVSTHVDYAVTEDESILRAESYQGLVNAILYFVNERRTGGTIRLYNYTGDVEADLGNARDEVMYEDPLGAFAVRSLNYETTRVLTYYEVELRVAYARTAQEMDSLREVTGLAGVRQELARLVSGQQRSAVFLASYFSGDRGMVETLLVESIYNAPALFCYPTGPGVDLDYEISLYPETGTRRVIEVKVTWRESERESAQRVEELERVASVLLEANPPAGEGYGVEELAAIVRAAHGGEDVHGTSLAGGVLSGEPASDQGLLMAMEYLCQQCGIEAAVAWGEGPWQSWLIVGTQQGYRHLLPDALYAPDEGAEEPAEPFRLYTDQELVELGYAWDMALYPACVDEAAQALSEEGQ